ncbi:MAG: CaiB/BaiF CoA transferase family protein [Acidimicrobiia bacterium]
MTGDPHLSAPLLGVRVVEFGNLVAAPYCGMLLADLGAEVIKVEPVTGDLARAIGPFYEDESAFFLGVNRGKLSLAVDPKDERVTTALLRLCQQSDVVTSNLRRGAMERMGLGYESLRALAPHLVVGVISAFGSKGPAADRAGIDLIFQGESGMMSITGGEEEGPHKTATTIADFLAGTNAALAITSALVGGGGRRGGRGTLVETSLRDGIIAAQATWNAMYFSSGRQPDRTGTASPVTGPNQTFNTADGYLNLAVVSDRHFADTCRALGLDHLNSDPRFTTNELRVRHRGELSQILVEVLANEPTGHWLKVLEAVGVPVGRILEMEAVFADEQVIFNEMVTEVSHPRIGTFRTQGSPLRVNDRPARSAMPPPVLGQHTVVILGDLGISDAEIAELVAAGAAVDGSRP